MLTAVLLGFVLGLRHAAEPDHLAAIAALVARHGRARAAARIGAAWGLGHSATILAVGGALVALRIAVEPRWTLLADGFVAAILLGLGIANLRAFFRAGIPDSAHVHDLAHAHGIPHAHDEPHARGPGHVHAADAWRTQPAGPHPHAAPALGGSALRAFGIGIAHGLGGSAAVALLALAAMPGTAAALAYLGVFGAGTIGGMVALSFGLALPLAATGWTPAFSRWMLAGSGALSIGVGCYLAWTVGSAALPL